MRMKRTTHSLANGNANATSTTILSFIVTMTTKTVTVAVVLLMLALTSTNSKIDSSSCSSSIIGASKSSCMDTTPSNIVLPLVVHAQEVVLESVTPSASPAPAQPTMSPQPTTDTPIETPTSGPGVFPGNGQGVGPSGPPVGQGVGPVPTNVPNRPNTPGFNPFEFFGVLITLFGFRPTPEPTTAPSQAPTVEEEEIMTVVPSNIPSIQPTTEPFTPSGSSVPSLQPSNTPSLVPSVQPSITPSLDPSSWPSLAPSIQPSSLPSVEPSLSMIPSVSLAPSTSMVPTVTPVPFFCQPGTPTRLNAPGTIYFLDSDITCDNFVWLDGKNIELDCKGRTITSTLNGSLLKAERTMPNPDPDSVYGEGPIIVRNCNILLDPPSGTPTLNSKGFSLASTEMLIEKVNVTASGQYNQKGAGIVVYSSRGKPTKLTIKDSEFNNMDKGIWAFQENYNPVPGGAGVALDFS